MKINLAAVTDMLSFDAGADRVVRLERNSGKGAAVRAGVAVATGRTVVFTDADLAYGPAQAAALVLQVEAGYHQF